MDEAVSTPNPARDGAPGELLRPGRPEASAVIWRWREPAASPAAANARLRREGVIRGLIGGAVGLAFFLFHHPRIATVAWVISGFVLLAALVSPGGLYRAIGRALAAFGRGIGRLLAILLLTPVFFLVFAVGGRLLRSGRRDKLQRWFDRGTTTYWQRREDAPRDRASYGHQF